MTTGKYTEIHSDDIFFVFLQDNMDDAHTHIDPYISVLYAVGEKSYIGLGIDPVAACRWCGFIGGLFLKPGYPHEWVCSTRRYGTTPLRKALK